MEIIAIDEWFLTIYWCFRANGSSFYRKSETERMKRRSCSSVFMSIMCMEEKEKKS